MNSFYCKSSSAYRILIYLVFKDNLNLFFEEEKKTFGTCVRYQILFYIIAI